MNPIEKVKRLFRKLRKIAKQVFNTSKSAEQAQVLLYLAQLFKVISNDVRGDITRTIIAGNDIVLTGIDGFQNLAVTTDELIGLLKVLITDAFPNDLPQPKSELAVHVLARTVPVTTELSDDFAIRNRAIDTDEFIELAKRKLKGEETGGDWFARNGGARSHHGPAGLPLVLYKALGGGRIVE